MKTYKLKKILTDSQANKLKTKFLSDKHYSILIKDDCDAYDINGNLLFRFRKKAIPIETLRLGYESFKKSIAAGGGRGIAAGGYINKIKKDGTTSNFDTSPIVESGNVGFMDARPGSGVVATCRKTSFAKKYFEEFSQGIPFVNFINDKYSEICPDHYKIQKAIADGTNRNYIIGNTCFTTVTVNKNFRTAVHKDSGDLPDGFGNLIVYREGEWTGGYFCLPQYGVAIDLQNTDILFVDVHQWHGNTAFKNIDNDWLRISFVLYYREYMYKCSQPSEELSKIKINQTGYFKI